MSDGKCFMGRGLTRRMMWRAGSIAAAVLAGILAGCNSQAPLDFEDVQKSVFQQTGQQVALNTGSAADRRVETANRAAVGSPAHSGPGGGGGATEWF